MTMCSNNLWGDMAPLATPMPVGKGADMSELQAQHCITPKQ